MQPLQTLPQRCAPIDRYHNKTVIFYLHGFSSSPASRKARFFAERLSANGHQVSIPNLDGGDFENLTLTRQLRILEEEAHGRPVSLIGSSMGGYLATLYAAKHPEVRRVVLMAPAFGFARRWPDKLGIQVTDAWRREGSMEVFHYGSQQKRRVGYQLLEDGLQYPDYPKCGQPCLIFHGQKDDVVPVDFSKEFVKRQPNAELHVWDSDHELTNVLEPMWEKVKTFLA